MSATPVTPLGVFSDPDTGLWAMIVGGSQARLALVRGFSADATESVEWQVVSFTQDDPDIWLVSGANADLKVEIAAAGSRAYEGDGTLAPCRLTGTANVGERSTEIDIPGALTTLPPTGSGSVRIFSSSFADGHEIALVSVRPAGAKGQDGDLINVVARGEEAAIIFDPRLSTTYGSGGHPRKAGIEMWLGEDEDGEQYPLRVSGVATGAHLTTTDGQLTVRAYALHCLFRADTGSGVYVLAES